MGFVDLHIHTTASDGTKSPSEIVRYAKEKGLQAIAITDHDTIEGIDEGLFEAKKVGIELIPGVEISVEYPLGSMHILGFFIDNHNPVLNEKLNYLQKVRSERNPRIVEKLNSLGINITYEEVLRASGGGQVGRPHFAQVLFEKGYVKTYQEAFERFLKKGAPAYIDKARFTPKEAINFIKEAKGIPVLAHPNTLNIKDIIKLEEIIFNLIDEGIKGIEVYYPEHSSIEVDQYKEIAKKYSLIITGGTDYHGFEKDNLEIGIGKGDMKLLYSMVEDLKSILKQEYGG